MKPAAIISTFPDQITLKKIIKQLLEEHIVACVNTSKISSAYHWEGKIQNDDEYLAIFKTTQKNKKVLKKRLEQLHPYDTPEIAEIDISSINSSYMKWLSDSTR